MNWLVEIYFLISYLESPVKYRAKRYGNKNSWMINEWFKAVIVKLTINDLRWSVRRTIFFASNIGCEASELRSELQKWLLTLRIFHSSSNGDDRWSWYDLSHVGFNLESSSAKNCWWVNLTQNILGFWSSYGCKMMSEWDWGVFKGLTGAME